MTTGAGNARATGARRDHDTALRGEDRKASPALGLATMTGHDIGRAVGCVPAPWRRVAGAWIGDLAYRLAESRRKATVATMRVVARETGRDDPMGLARASWRAYGATLAEALPLVMSPDQPWGHLVGEVSGWNYLEDALAAGRGAVIVGLHQGNWEVGATMIAARVPLAAVVDPVGPPAIDAVVQASRRARGIRTIPVERGARGALEALRQGLAVAILVDRPVEAGPGTATVPFLGVRATLPTGAIRLARRTGAPLVPVVSWRRSDGLLGFAACDPIHIRDLDTDVALLGTVIGALEPSVRLWPDGWFMFREMWTAPATGHEGGTQVPPMSPAPSGRDARGPGPGRRDVTVPSRDLTARGLAAWNGLAAATAMRVGASIVPRLPEGMARSLASGAGQAIAALATDRRAVMEANLAEVIGTRSDDAGVRAAVAAAERLQAENYIDLLRARVIGRPEVTRRVENGGPGWPDLKADLGVGGAVLVSAHLGRLELLAHALSREGIRAVLMVERLRPAAVHGLVTSLRLSPTLEVITADDGLLRASRALKSGRLLVVLIDWVPSVIGASPDSGIPAMIGCARSRLPSAPFRLAARLGVPIHFGYGLALPGGRVRAIVEARVAGAFGAEVTWERGGADHVRAACAVGRRLGDVIRLNPGQWTLAHRLS